MKYRLLGDTQIEVSEIGFGAWGIGGDTKGAFAYGPTDDKVSELALLKAYDQGITFYDTAPLYGYGHSEELIGSALKNVREKIVLATKVGAVTEYLNQDNSTLIEANNIDQITNALNDFVINKPLWDTRAEVGKNTIIKKFTSEIMAKNYLNHFIQNLS